MVGLPELKEYVEGYTDRQALLEVAFRFSKLGEKTQHLDKSAASLYSGTHFFIYDTVMKCCRSGKIKNIDLDIGEDLIPVSTDKSCDEFIPEISCIISMYDRVDDLVDYDFELFPSPLKLNLHHYAGFAKESCEKAGRTAMMGISIHHFSLDTFARYAYHMGCGMPIREAVVSRRAEMQKEYYFLQ